MHIPARYALVRSLSYLRFVLLSLFFLDNRVPPEPGQADVSFWYAT